MSYVGLLGAPVAVTIWWLWRYLLLPLPPLEQFPDGAGQLPAIRGEEPPRIWSILDADQIEVATTAVRSSIRPNLVRSRGYLRYLNRTCIFYRWLGRNQLPVGARSILDAEHVGVAAAAIRGSIRPMPGRRGSPGYPKYPEIHYLEAVPDVRLLDPNTMEEIIRGLPAAAAAAVEMLRQASIQYDPIGRLPDVVRNPSILFADPCVLATESTEMVMELKTTTVLVCLIWLELNGQNRQLCQEVKEEWFALVIRRSVEKLLAVARSFSDANWCSCHVSQVLTIFDTLADVLYNIQRLPFDRSHEVAGISSNMVNAIRGMLEGTTDDIDSSEEFAIHRANDVLVQVLGFFHDNRDELQSILGTGDPCSDMFNCWVSKLEADAEMIFQDEKDRRYIFLFNNACYAWQMMRRPGGSFSNVELVSRLISMIQRYKKRYFDECWVPVIMSYLEGDSLKRPRCLFLGKFIAEFLIICDRQMTWKVPAELMYKLRQEIVDLIVQPYEEFLSALQANPSRLSEALYSLKRFMQGKKKQKEYTVAQLNELILNLFESSNAS